MANKLPTLSTSGYVEDIAEKADRMMSYYFVSDASQTNLYRGEITSLPLQVQRWGSDDRELARAVRSELEGFFKRYFDDAQVNCSTDHPAPNDPNRINLTLDCVVIQDGKRYSLGRLIETVNSTIVKIVDINNNQGG